jgi:oligosaccharide reducing-end xylanase
MNPRCLAALLALTLALPACGTTLDSLGGNSATGEAPTGPLGALSGPASYGNAFRDLLSKSDAQIETKIDTAFTQLFYGDPVNQAIYVPLGNGQALMQDVLHNDVRSEGIGIGMIVAVELNKQTEFDSLWAYANAALLQKTGASRGYYNSFCDDGDACLDPYGMQLFLTALLFANDRWGNGTYATDAGQLLTLLRHADDSDSAIPAIGVFDPTTYLVREQPLLSTAGYTRSALEMPAMYALWAQASGDSFWSQAASAARAHLVAAADVTTGLWPMRSYFDGAPVSSSDTFMPQAYRTHINLALDALWSEQSTGETAVADRLLGFFTTQGLNTYGASYALDGTVLDFTRAQGLVAANGALAVAATRANRSDFVSAVWDMAIPSGPSRYYDGVLYLLSLLVLSGQYRVY